MTNFERALSAYIGSTRHCPKIRNTEPALQASRRNGKKASVDKPGKRAAVR